ncbi:MAG: protein translocase subunit SecD [Anaerofustis sp.]
MKTRKDKIKLSVLLIAIILFAAIFFTGIPLSKIAGVYDIQPTNQLLNYGLDLTGGVYIVLQADESAGNITDDTLDKAIATIRTRIDSLGVKEPTITKQDNDKIRISLPDVSNQQEAIDMVGKTAELQFLGPNGELILTGSDISDASYSLYYDTSGISSPAVKLEFNDEGKTLFSTATALYLNKEISITLDGETINTATVNTQITDGVAYITGIGSKDEAVNLATLIRAGALPVSFTIAQVQTIGPTLGQDSLQRGFIGGLIGVILVLLFMLLYYKGPGIAADIALMVYSLIFLFVLALMQVTLTLPGIAGIILSIGMAVDANVIIFERIKEELRLGKSMFSSIESGFHRALTTIIDSNVTTLIAGCALFFFGSGTIRGFAVTLILGVIISMFTAIFVTKRVLKMIINIFNIRRPSFFGIKGVE